MIAAAGQVGLYCALGATVWSLFASAAAGAGWSGDWLGRARLGLGASAVALVATIGLLAAALVRADYSLDYIAAHTDRALSAGLRLTALWSGEQGSLLLWAALLACAATVAGATRRRTAGAGEWVTLGILAGLVLFFAALLAFAANPFRVTLPAPIDGHGLHPQLRHWAMIVHPPMLLLGSAASAVPFAIMCGAMVAGRADHSWVVGMRRWAIAAWLFMGAGMVLGAVWAYLELGWGGYWAWDAVENVALLPWLTGTALIHAIVVHQHRGSMKGWTAGLSAATLILVILGAAITRSGLVQSVHSFAGSGTGAAFSAAAGVLAIGSAALLISRRRVLNTSAVVANPLSREGVSLAAIVVLAVIAAAVLVGTVFPVVSRLVAPASVSLASSYYTRTVGPLGIALVAMMALSPMLVYGRGPGVTRWMAGILAGGFTVVALIGLAAGFSSPIVLVCIGLLGVTVSAVVAELVRAIAAFSRDSGYGLAGAAARIIDGNHRRYGGQLAHAGVALVVVGLAGSSLLTISAFASVRTGETFTIGSRTLRLDGLSQSRGEDCSTVEASISELRAGVPVRVLRPQRRFYDLFGDAAPRVAVASGWREDLYLTLVGWEPGGTEATVEAHINPLTIWIWIGGGLVTFAGVFCLLPRLLPRPVVVDPESGPSAASGERRGASAEVRPAAWAIGLRKEIGGRAVIDGVDLRLMSGSFTAILGANGAGKTTLLRLLAMLTPPTDGLLMLFGKPSQKVDRALRARIGFIGHQLMLYRDLSARENLEFFARLHGVPYPRARARELLGLIGLSERENDPVRSLSRGQAQRIAIARALVHSPELVLADEPFSGLDAASTQWLRGQLAELRRRGTTIVLTHHHPREAVRLADRVLVLEAGRVVLDRDARETDPQELAHALEARP